MSPSCLPSLILCFEFSYFDILYLFPCRTQFSEIARDLRFTQRPPLVLSYRWTERIGSPNMAMRLSSGAQALGSSARFKSLLCNLFALQTCTSYLNATDILSSTKYNQLFGNSIYKTLGEFRMKGRDSTSFHQQAYTFFLPHFLCSPRSHFYPWDHFLSLSQFEL